MEDAAGAIGVSLEQAKTGEPPGYFDWLINELRNTRPDVAMEVPGEADVRDIPSSVNAVSGLGELVKEEAPAIAPDMTDSPDPLPERIRLETSLVDRLIDLSSESSVYHSQIGRHQTQLTETLGELDQTVIRLRQQLRELDIESDVQIPANTDAPVVEEFDPLELDKYSRLQEISRSILESFSDLDDIRYSFGVSLRHAEVELNEQSRINNAIQETLAQIRMVRFGSIVSRLQETCIDAGKSCNKQVRLLVTGTDNVIDRSVLKQLTTALEHLLRNGVAHGIEDPGVRTKNGKPAEGQILVRMQLDDGDILLSVQDDGAGIDLDEVRRYAADTDFAGNSTDLTDQQILEILMQPGFTTAKGIDQISGRGVGLDTVNRNLLKVGALFSMAVQIGCRHDFPN